MSLTNQKDYLKKYLSIGKDSTEKKKKKKKIKSNNAPSRLVIIDDNADSFENAVKEDLLEDEDAPQIVAVIDDRPPSLRVNEKNNTNLWIPIGSSNNENSPERSQNLRDLSPPRNRVKLFVKKNENEDMSPLRRKYSGDKNNDNKQINADISPPRKDSKESISKTSGKYKSSRWEDNEDLDISPPRHNIVKSHKHNDDNSPPRKRSRDGHSKIVDKKKSSRWECVNSEASSSREYAYTNKDEHKNEKLEKKCKDEDNSPPRKKSEPSHQKMTKTLDGKTAGLQHAKQLAAETTLLKQKEDEIFKQLSSEISGENASTIFRDKRAGRMKNPEEEAEKKKKEDENKEKYSRWGRGLKQVEDATKKREEVLNEMSKPLARYANDEDLERYLKEQEREGDPMLAYIRKKKKKKDVEEGKPLKPEYMGEFMPNRFGIRPGHRWDGVDRSNGYEKKWFDIQNSRIAQQEDAYKWSTEDM